MPVKPPETVLTESIARALWADWVGEAARNLREEGDISVRDIKQWETTLLHMRQLPVRVTEDAKRLLRQVEIYGRQQGYGYTLQEQVKNWGVKKKDFREAGSWIAKLSSGGRFPTIWKDYPWEAYGSKWKGIPVPYYQPAGTVAEINDRADRAFPYEE